MREERRRRRIYPKSQSKPFFQNQVTVGRPKQYHCGTWPEKNRNLQTTKRDLRGTISSIELPRARMFDNDKLFGLEKKVVVRYLN